MFTVGSHNRMSDVCKVVATLAQYLKLEQIVHPKENILIGQPKKKKTFLNEHIRLTMLFWLFPHCFYSHNNLFCPLLLCWFTGTWLETWCHQLFSEHLSKYLDNSSRLKRALMCIFLCWFDRSSLMYSVIQYLIHYFYQEELWALGCTLVCCTLLMTLMWWVFHCYRNVVIKKNQTFVWMKTKTCVFTANRHQASLHF